MARSRRKQPFVGFSMAETEKKDKQLAHRKYRRRVRAVLHPEIVDGRLPQVRELSNPSSMGKDGKFRFDPDRSPHLMRK